MFSFTGSRGSFRGDTHFYGKQVRLHLIDLSCVFLQVLLISTNLFYIPGCPILHSSENHNQFVEAGGRERSNAYRHADTEVNDEAVVLVY